MTDEVYVVRVKFKKNRYFSNQNKHIIIDCLPGKYKVDFETLNDMNNLRTHSFQFSKKEIAENFAVRLFKVANTICDIEYSW